jgi:hypothetical protein
MNPTPLLSPRFFAIYGAEREAELIARFSFKARSTVMIGCHRAAGRHFFRGGDARFVMDNRQ